MSSGHFVYEVQRPVRWNSFLAGLAVNVVFIVLVMIVGPQLNRTVTTRKVDTSRFVSVIAPTYIPPTRQASAVAPEHIARPAQHLQIPKLSASATPILRTPSELAKVEPRKSVPVPPSEPQPTKVENPSFSSAAIAVPTPRPEIKTNVFDSAPAEIASVQEPARKVQTGGFGSPNGAAPNAVAAQNTLAMVRVGAFGLPAGPGQGNGTAGAHGISGTVHSSGFGATTAPADSAAVRQVAASGFGTPVVQNSGFSVQKIERTQRLEPVEIIYKPKPAYTAEARRMRVEGEVLLDVVFSANGSLRVNRVVRGLGYGLDDMALAAAQDIKFKPARRDGQPYDCAALVHMVFELTQ